MIEEKTSWQFINPPPSTCAVSVVIPMFNAEKFIVECLGSILHQTLQNFEVIVVDDCSTDSSCAIVESCVPKFDGRLKLSRTEKNSGPGVARNKGLKLSRGEYIFFMDADDFFAKAAALEELYTLAKNFDAEVVFCEKYFRANADAKTIQLTSYQQGGFVDKPTFETENLAERVRGILQGKFMGIIGMQLVARDFLVENEIAFAPMKGHEDTLHTWALIFRAKKFLRVPNAVYVYRRTEGSLSRKKVPPAQKIASDIYVAVRGVQALKNFAGEEFSRENPQWFYAIVNYFIMVNFNTVLEESLQLQPVAVYETIKQKFGDELGEWDVVIAALCTVVNTQQKILVANQQQFNQFAAQAQKKIVELEAALK